MSEGRFIKTTYSTHCHQCNAELPAGSYIYYIWHSAYCPSHKDELEPKTCGCSDSSCKKVGVIGEVDRHIDGCCCGQCHQALGKV